MAVSDATSVAQQEQQEGSDGGLDGPDKPPLAISRPASGTSRQRTASAASSTRHSPGTYSSSSDSLSLAGSSRPPSRADGDSSFTGPTAALSSRRSSNAAANGKPSRPPSVKSVKSDDGGHRFNLRDLLGAGSVRRKGSQRSDTSSRKSDSDQSDQPDGASTASFLKKYGVCGRVAIGKGATSVVRLAHKWDRSEEKLYAVKEFRKRRKNETEKEYVKKLTSEFCISSTLHHPNVVETVDLVQDENHNWCEVMEYCPGGDLYAAIKKGSMTPAEVECCFVQMLSGVAYLHTQGVAHRDIKPENIFFDARASSFHLQIGDYGASTVYRLPWETTVHKSTGLCGSEPYIAPEQFLNTPYDARLVDVWACGIVYYCMHFHEIPWRVAQQSDQLYAAYAQACSTSPTSCPPTISSLKPRECRPLIRKMLEPDPKQRVLIEDVVKHAWVQSIEVCTTGKPVHHAHTLCPPRDTSER
ncbi:Pkinase-domain-containing protein [Auriculariales sp. MPI-PUGE-AT-0066]|nr:Pkinase-domain-containing protein [Auriculariales sp. MPI-PUGE-AT-0066]